MLNSRSDIRAKPLAGQVADQACRRTGKNMRQYPVIETEQDVAALHQVECEQACGQRGGNRNCTRSVRSTAVAEQPTPKMVPKKPWRTPTGRNLSGDFS